MPLDLPPPPTKGVHKNLLPWLRSLRSAILSANPLAGRNISVSQERSKGTVIKAQRSRPDTPTPPGDCPLPEGDCPHALCVEFKLDNTDTANKDIVQLRGAGAFMGFYYDPSDNTWNLYGSAFVSMPATSAYDTWHRIVIQVTSNLDDTIHVLWSVDGVAGTPVDLDWPCNAMAAELDIGAHDGSGDVHRTVRLVNLVANPDQGYEFDFSFPADAFNTLTNATIDGDGFLQVDATGDDDAYGAKFLTYNMGCSCCVPRDVTEISTLTVTINVHAVANTCGCHFDKSGSATRVFHRIDRADTFTSDDQFKLYFVSRIGEETKCDLVFESYDPDVGIAPTDISVDDSECGDCAAACLYAEPDTLDVPGKYISIGEARVFVDVTNNPEGDGGTLKLTVAGDCNVVCSASDCGGGGVGCTAFTQDLADNTVSFTTDNVPGVEVTVTKDDTYEGGCCDESSHCDCLENCEEVCSIACYPCHIAVLCSPCDQARHVTATATLA